MTAPSRALRTATALVAAAFAAVDLWIAWSGSAAFARMWSDFGSVLPATTVFALTWGRWLLSLVAIGGASVAVRTALRGRRTWPGEAATAVEVVALVLFLWAMYLPEVSLMGGLG